MGFPIFHIINNILYILQFSQFSLILSIKRFHVSSLIEDCQSRYVGNKNNIHKCRKYNEYTFSYQMTFNITEKLKKVPSSQFHLARISYISALYCMYVSSWCQFCCYRLNIIEIPCNFSDISKLIVENGAWAGTFSPILWRGFIST